MFVDGLRPMKPDGSKNIFAPQLKCETINYVESNNPCLKYKSLHHQVAKLQGVDNLSLWQIKSPFFLVIYLWYSEEFFSFF